MVCSLYFDMKAMQMVTWLPRTSIGENLEALSTGPNAGPAIYWVKCATAPIVY